MFTSNSNSPPTTWTERLKHVSHWRKEVKRSFGDSITHIQILDSIQIGSRQLGPVVIGLGNLPTDGTPPVQTLVYAEINSNAQGDRLELRPLLNIDDFGSSDEKRPSAELTLYFERTRSQIWNGIMSYSSHLATQSLLLTTTNGIFVYRDGEIQHVGEWCQGEPMNADFCPADADYVAFCSKGQLYIDRTNQLIFTTASHDPSHDHPYDSSHDSSTGITNGLASFVVQEELERDKGFWWHPHIIALVYERVDSRQVTELSFAAPGKPPQDSMRYPLCGTENAKSHLHLVLYDEEADVFVDRPLLTFIEKFVPDYEYIACAGWNEDGESFYVITMNRLQTKRSIILIGKEAFTFSSSEPRDLPIRVLYEEESGTWVNNNQLTHFLPSASDSISLIYGSEKSDLCHLYMLTVYNDDDQPSEEYSITAGDNWTVIKEARPTVDLERQHIYYLANPESPLSTSLCVSSYASPFCQDNKVLTPTDMCYRLDRADFDLHVQPDIGFVCWLSSIKQLPECRFYSLVHHSNQLLPSSQLHHIIKLQPEIASLICTQVSPELQKLSDVHMELPLPESSQPDVPMSPAPTDLTENSKPLMPSDLFAHGICEVPLEDGTMIQCLVLLPTHNPNNSENFLLFITSMQVLVFKISQFLKFITAGYAVFLADSRGSCNRGILFEGAIKNNMGSVEVDDQVYALKYAAEHYFPLLNMDRIGVTGWSYGGYMALQMISQHPELYKCSIPAGAVVDWNLYDTAYTERYMGKPNDNVAYKASSILSRVASLPDEEGRLLIIHGLIDENVHFHHTEKLINALINAGKPHKLLIFPSERHGIRKAESVEYLHASMLSFFDQNLKSQ